MVRKTVDEAIKKLRAAWTGKEVRDRMADTIEAINDEVIDTTSKQEKLNTKFNDLIINAGNSNAEVATARKGHATVGDRLDEFDSQLDNIETQKATKQELDVERRRMDSFTKLQEGSTTGDAELIDGRNGADGVTYENIGGAIRKQLKKNKMLY